MELQSIKRLASRNGQEAALMKSFLKDFINDLAAIASKEIARKIVFSHTKTVPEVVLETGRVQIPVVVNAKMAGETLAKRIKSISWLQTKYSSSYKEIVVDSFLNRKLVEKSFSKLNAVQMKIVEKTIGSCGIRTRISIQTSSSSAAANNPRKSKIKKLTKSILKEQSLTPFDIGLKPKVKYTLAKLDSIVNKGICKHPNAALVLQGILSLARSKSKKKLMIQSGLIVRDLGIIQKNFLIVAAAVSALYANPKCKLMFTNNGFVLFYKDHPIGRFGKKVKQGTMKELFEKCRKECGSFPGKPKAIMDVIDAEGKKKENRLKEVFNDFAKHIKTNSSGPAAKAAKKLKRTAQVVEELNWTTFKKSFDEAAKHVKEIDFDPMVKDMEKTVRELNQGRNVLKMSSMKWMDIFRKKQLNWLGTLAADILEDEVNHKPLALKALSCVANWLENRVECTLSIKHVGSEGESIHLTPCSSFKMNEWEIELQDIMKTGPKWKKA